MNVSSARYYAWRKQQRLPVAQPAEEWEEVLKEVVGQHKRCYGTRRLRVELRVQGHRVGRWRLRTAMRQHGLRAIQPRPYTPRTTDLTHGLRCAPNRLLDRPKPTQANQVWVSDSTYLPLASGQWAYLCAFQDACTRQVVGWLALDTMPEELVTSALRQALLTCQPAPGLVVHSDRGGKYCANAYCALLAQHECLRSQSRRAECLNNAQAESLWSRLKTEQLGPRE